MYCIFQSTFSTTASTSDGVIHMLCLANLTNFQDPHSQPSIPLSRFCLYSQGKLPDTPHPPEHDIIYRWPERCSETTGIGGCYIEMKIIIIFLTLSACHSPSDCVQLNVRCRVQPLTVAYAFWEEQWLREFAQEHLQHWKEKMQFTQGRKVKVTQE